MIDGNNDHFGTTNVGGANGFGTAWEWGHGSSSITPLVSFSVLSGYGPGGPNGYPGSLVLDGNGDLFDTSFQGGAAGDGPPGSLNPGIGTVFEVKNSVQPPLPAVQFHAASETINAGTGTFSIPVSLSVASASAVSVPFTLGGTAVGGGIDYKGVTVPLVIPAGHTSATITGTLIPHTGANKTLVLTLKTPAGATLGAIKVNTLTLTEP